MDMKPPPSPVMQFKVSLRHIRPTIWRRILVDYEDTLGDLHHAIQAAMGWGGYHMHVFIAGRDEYGDPTLREMSWMNEWEAPLWKVFPKERAKVRYDYDFGDGWEHGVVFEKLLMPDPALKYPRCIAGERACPPEDCGSYPGYEQICALIADPKLPDPHGLRGWMPPRYDPEKFDLKAANKRLSGKG